MVVMVEFRCPVAGRKFGEALPEGVGEVTFACRDCARIRREAGEPGMVIHAFGVDGTYRRTVTIDARPRPQ